jgi:dTDP-4-dehydrorhamnose 3,5-epimerase
MQETNHSIAGVTSRRLAVNEDDRGCLTEIFRAQWHDETGFVQWNMVASNANVLRGVHVHFRHFDYLLVSSGQMRLGLKDVRQDSATFGQSDVQLLRGDTPTVWMIPPGVAHGFYFPVESTMLFGVSHYWDKADEIACRWTDPELGFALTDTRPLLSQRDAAAGSLADLVEQYRAARQTHD